MRRILVRRIAGIASMLVLALFGFGCAGLSEKGQGVMVDAAEVTERDIEVARQMSAPETVIASMEAGEWRYASDREAVRYAELAIDYMQETYGQACRAVWTDIPWVLSDVAKVTLVAEGGAYDGAELTVSVSVGVPRTYSDTWGAVMYDARYEQMVCEVLAEAFADVPETSWDAEVWIDNADDVATLPESEALTSMVGSVEVVASRSVVPTMETADRLREVICGGIRECGLTASYYLIVPASDPIEGPMTVAFGKDAAIGEDEEVFLRDSDYVDGGAQ